MRSLDWRLPVKTIAPGIGPTVAVDHRRDTWVPGESDIFTRYARIKRRSLRAIRFIEGECLVPAGRGAGQPYRLLPFQRRLLRQTLDGGVLEAIW